MKEGYLNMMIIGLLALVISLVSSQRIVDHHRKVAERKSLSIQQKETKNKNSKERRAPLPLRYGTSFPKLNQEVRP
ncbi:hypothetical protein HOF92_07170 [bacterium]|jgi:hypothetical protein|nr:hypothetical protein [bacterium]